ncbi:molybdopterin-guanine dinucleotide biosynthesis protein MobA [Actinokineospora sp. UTMC 2448]|nr:molybdopterin-guanine dinucleotide biosynthesis protein MobA [Actinokineospora sp. UTMC 2448]
MWAIKGGTRVGGVRWAAIVLAGGRGSRLGGIDKPALVIGGMTLLDRAVAAVEGADPVIVVGPRRHTARPVVWTREVEPGSGPVAALAAGLSAVDTAGTVPALDDTAPDMPARDIPAPEVVVLLAADLPAVDCATVRRVRDAVGETGAVLVDTEGRDQWLLSAWRVDVLRAAVERSGRGLYAVLGPLAPVRVPDPGGASSDLDTPADLDRWR